MKRQLICMAASVAALGAGLASAQTYPSYAYGNGDGYGQARTVRCESIDSRQQRCRIDANGEVRIARQLSRQMCIQGRNWDYSRGEIRVSGGCRADFVVMGDDRRYDDRRYDDRRYGDRNDRQGRDQVVRCDARGQGRSYCGDAYGQYTMVGYRNGNCIEGRTFGQDSRGLWVSGNCNAQFRRLHDGNRDDYGRQDAYIRCVSNSSGRSYCGDANTRYTLRDTSNRYCVEGRTYGTDQRGLWVSNPCQGEFVRTGTGYDPRHDTYPDDQPYYERDYQRN
jgi:hypothetical protein